MYEGFRQDGKYFLRPIAPDEMHKITEVGEDWFFDRWRRWGGSETDIAAVKAHTQDFSVF